MKIPEREDFEQIFDDLSAVGTRLSLAIEATDHPYLRQMLINSQTSYKQLLSDLSRADRMRENLNLPIDYGQRISQISE